MISLATHVDRLSGTQSETFAERNQREGSRNYPSPIVRRVQEKLARLEELSSNWDHQGARKIDRLALRSAMKFASNAPWHLLRAPHIAPTPDGNVQMEWHHGDISLEVEFGADGNTYYLKWDPAKGVEQAGEIADYQADGQQLLRWFAGKTRNVDC